MYLIKGLKRSDYLLNKNCRVTTLILFWFPFFTVQRVAHADSSTLIKSAIDFNTNFVFDPNISTFRENYVTLKMADQHQEVDAVTFCFRIKYYSTIINCLFSQNILFESGLNEGTVGFISFHPRLFHMFQLKEALVPLKWYHICAAYKNCRFMMVVNNEKIEDRVLSATDCADVANITLHPTLQVGRCSDETTYSYVDNPLRSITRGTLTALNIWSKMLTIQEMKLFTKTCQDTGSKPDLISWNQRNVIKQGSNAKQINLSANDVCSDKHKVEKSSILIWPHQQIYSEAKKTCELLGGTFPLPKNDTELQNFESYFLNNSRFDSNHNDIVKHQCGNEFWLPIKQMPAPDNAFGNHTWMVDLGTSSKLAKYLPWAKLQPNGQDIQQCVIIFLTSKIFWDIGCNEVRCSLCEFKGSVDFTLHGLNKKSVIDRNYIFVPQTQKYNTLSLIGHKTSMINWNSKTSQWKITDTSLKVPDLGHYNLTKPGVVIGRFSWHLTRYWDPNNNTMEIRDLKLSKVQNRIV